MITPAQTFLNKNKIPYKEYEYKCTVDSDFGKFAAHSLGLDENIVFKTILLSDGKTYVTCVVPVNALISTKNLARLLKLKKLDVVEPNTAQRVTGYVVGGISPFGQKKRGITVLHESALNYDEILVSGGRRGFSVGIKPSDLINSLNAKTGNVIE